MMPGDNQSEIRYGIYSLCVVAFLYSCVIWFLGLFSEQVADSGFGRLAIGAYYHASFLIIGVYLVAIVYYVAKLIHLEGLTLKRIPYILVLMLVLCFPALARPKLVWSPVDGAVEYVVQWHLDGREQIGALTVDAAALADGDRWVTVGTSLGCEYEPVKPFGYWRVLARHVDGGLSDPSAVLAVSRPTLQTSIVAMREMAGGE